MAAHDAEYLSIFSITGYHVVWSFPVSAWPVASCFSRKQGMRQCRKALRPARGYRGGASRAAPRAGWSTKLNPDIRIMETLREMLPMDWRERMSRTVDKLVAADVEV
jgi:hypothetical protein